MGINSVSLVGHGAGHDGEVRHEFGRLPAGLGDFELALRRSARLHRDRIGRECQRTRRKTVEWRKSTAAGWLAAIGDAVAEAVVDAAGGATR